MAKCSFLLERENRVEISCGWASEILHHLGGLEAKNIMRFLPPMATGDSDFAGPSTGQNHSLEHLTNLLNLMLG